MQKKIVLIITILYIILQIYSILITYIHRFFLTLGEFYNDAIWS